MFIWRITVFELLLFSILRPRLRRVAKKLLLLWFSSGKTQPRDSLKWINKQWKTNKFQYLHLSFCEICYFFLNNYHKNYVINNYLKNYLSFTSVFLYIYSSSDIVTKYYRIHTDELFWTSQVFVKLIFRIHNVEPNRRAKYLACLILSRQCGNGYWYSVVSHRVVSLVLALLCGNWPLI